MEEKYFPILYGIEKAIVEEYKAGRIKTGNSAKIAIDELIYFYKKRRDKQSTISEEEMGLKERIRKHIQEILGTKIADLEVTNEVVISCLNKTQKSVTFWTNSNGATGYFEYVKDFVAGKIT